MKLLAATLAAATNADVLKITLRTADSTSSSRYGTAPQVLVSSCDGTVKFQDDFDERMEDGDSRTWTINNYEAGNDKIEFITSSDDGWLVEPIELQVCDDAGANCQNQVVGEVYPGDITDSGNVFWIDGDCSSLHGHDYDGCDDTLDCNCYKEKFFLQQVGNEWIIDDEVDSCKARMNVECNDGDLVQMTARIAESQVHGQPSAEFTLIGGYWEAVYAVADLDKSFEDDVVIGSRAADDYLVLSKTVSLPCKNVLVDGVNVCQEVGSGLTWTCRYSLADQTKSDGYQVTGQDTEATADGIGTLNYELVVLADKTIGEQVQFEIRPANPGLVTADIKHCEVAESSAANAVKVSIIGTGVDAKDKCYVSDIASGLSTDSGTGTLAGHWNAFKWSTSDATDAENQVLSCSIALSENGNGQAAGAAC